MNKQNKIIVFDTTLRDGEQSPGASMNMEAKLQIAHQLERLGVDVIEAGFPIASQGDFEAVSKIAQELKTTTVCGLARAVEKDIRRCWESLKHAVKPRIHTFIATSPIHRKAKLKMSKQEVVDNAVKAISLAKTLCEDVEFSAEDATRTELEFLKEVAIAAAQAGATTINIPDTVGYTMPSEYAEIIKAVRSVLPDDIVLSVHCHNDLGMASANSLVALQNGANQIECTLNGIGERAGNAAMEEVIMSVLTRKDIFEVESNINTSLIYPTSMMVSRLSGISIQKNKAIVGENAFRHEAGIHQHGVLQDKQTYEIMSPESIGRTEESLVLGKHSGKHAILDRLENIGIDSSKIDVDNLFIKFKELADKKKQVYDDELLALVNDQIGEIQKTYEIVYMHTISGSGTVPSSTVRMQVNSDPENTEMRQEASAGDGPVDACYQAINKITGIDCTLVDYAIKAVSVGGDSMGEVTVIIKESADAEEIKGRGVSTDIIEASARAYVSALNRLCLQKQIKEKRITDVHL